MRPIFEYYNPRARRVHCPFFDYSYLLRTARNLAAVVAALHDRGYVIGDVNESNILVAETALVTVVDTDSFQVRDGQRGSVYRCPVGKPDFTPPELQGVSFSQLDRGPEHDRFGLAVLLFQLLMEGTHPFDGRKKSAGEATLRHDRIKAGHFPYGRRRIPYEPSPATPPLDLLHPRLQTLFLNCFVKGHKNPKARPDANAWMAALEEAEAALSTCKKNARHRYGKHLRKCPWCERKVLLGGRDPFPAIPADVNAQPKPPPAPKRVPPRPVTPAAPPSPPPASKRGPRLIVSRTTVRRIPPGAAATTPSAPTPLARAKERVMPFIHAAWKRPALKKLTSTPPPQYAGVVTLLRTPIDGSPTVWTGMTLLFAMLAFVPGLGFGAGLTAVACGVTEYRRMDRITLGSVLGVGIGAGLAVRSVVMGMVLAVLAIFPGLFPSSALRRSEGVLPSSGPSLVRFSSALSTRPPRAGVRSIRPSGDYGSRGRKR
jgi:serine/threonine protein kinase